MVRHVLAVGALLLVTAGCTHPGQTSGATTAGNTTGTTGTTSTTGTGTTGITTGSTTTSTTGGTTGASPPSVAFDTTSIQVVCKVSNTKMGGADNLACNADMTGADLGITAFDGVHTWIFFGDANTSDDNAWKMGADSTGYFSGQSPATGLCTQMNLVTITGYASKQTCGADAVFAPDFITPPKAWSEPIGDFVFAAVTAPAAGPSPPANAAIPGTNEVPTGAFSYGGNLYEFYQGSPWINPGSSYGGPVGSVSYLAVWKNPSAAPQTLSAASRRVVSKVDLNLDNPSYPPPPRSPVPSPLPSPTPPPGWGASPPLGGAFVQVAPVLAADASGTNYLYLFGAGEYRASHIAVARLTMPQPGSPLEGTLAEYLVQTPGFSVWTGTSWATFNGSNIATLDFADDTTADIGELSVQYYAAQKIWLMMYTPSKMNGHVVMRWATEPTGPWSSQQIVLDMSTQTNRNNYCCQGTTTGTDSSGLPVWSCTGTQIVECGDAANKVGAPRYGLYSPYLLPYLTSAGGNAYTAWFVLSSFEPYGDELLSYTIDVTP